MKLVNQYIIPFTGLSEGSHEFSFSLGKSFFDSHPLLEAIDGEVNTKVLLKKNPGMLELSTELSGEMKIQCDRCLEYFNFPVTYKGELVVKFGEDTSASTDEIWIISPAENTLDLEQYFFECIGLIIPIQRAHPDKMDGTSGCDPKMIEMLRSLSAQNENDKKADPRWNKLKDLLNNLNTN